MSDNEPVVPRLSARAFFDDVASELFSLDRGVPYTLWQLLIRPGPTIRRYVERRDQRLTKPFRLVLICLAAAALLATLTAPDFGRENVVGPRPAGADGVTVALWSALNRVAAHFDWILVGCWVPAMAAAVQAAYRRHELNYAEAFVFGLYTLPQMLAWMALVLALVVLVPAISGWVVLLPILLPVLLSAHGYFRPASEPWWRAVWCALMAGFSLVVLMLGVVMGLTLVGILGE